jgi:outer membrane protein assembly factor BamD
LPTWFAWLRRCAQCPEFNFPEELEALFNRSTIPHSRKACLAALLGLGTALLPGCAAVNKMHHPDPGLVFAPGEQPDIVLYRKATNEINHARYEVGRLTLQTLINTYPDSEYLSRAKLEIANSYFSEGGVSGLTQAEAEYKDFITFFPTAPEAPEAQYRVGMAHFRLMAKADRDQTEAKLADAEFKEFLLKYPDSPLITRVKGRLRQTQEVLAEGDYYTANYYYTHGAYLAARSRFQEIVDNYPNFSGGDAALYYEGQSLERLRRAKEASPYYAHVITDFPLSPLVPQAKARLTALKQPIPRPTRAMLARAEADATHHPQRDWLSKLGGLVASAPDTSATLFGPVHIGQTGGGIETANAPQAAPGAKASIVVTPVPDKSLEPSKPAEAAPSGNPAASSSSKPAEAAPGGNPAASSSTDTDKAKENNSTKSQTESTQPTGPAKKKSRFHVLKKVVKPF